jgi:cytochrome P450 family 6
MSNINFIGIVRFIIGSAWPELAKKLKLGFTTKDVNDYFLKIFVQTLEDREKNPIQRNDFVNLLLGLKDDYTKEELAAEAFVVFFGGFETSSSLMTFILYELALNEDIQNRLREEIVTGIDENDGKLTYDMLFGFKYLDMVINEGLRKYPPIPSTMRKANKEYTIPGTKLVIPEGVVIALNSFSFQRDPEYFPDPEKFDPERFNEENIKNVKSFTNFPFGEGPRICLGQRFGLMQSKIGITKLIKNFVIQPSEKTQIPIKFNLGNPLMAPENGMWLRFTKI